jgi:two-component sensor histidine kinase
VTPDRVRDRPTIWQVDERVPFRVDDVPPLRRRVVADAERHGLSAEAVASLALVVGELVANAVRHASPLSDGHIAVAWGGDRDSVRFEVTDGGAGSLPRVMAGDPTDTGGRGLMLVRHLAAAWGTDVQPGRTTVWATIRDHAS